MKQSVIAALAIACIAVTPAKADLICPKGSLHDFANMQLVWDQYRNRNTDYLEQWHRRLSIGLETILDAVGLNSQMEAGSNLGRDRAILMQRMFEQGFIAATDIVNADCVQAPDMVPWSEHIREERRAAWCREWGDAHFCPK